MKSGEDNMEETMSEQDTAAAAAAETSSSLDSTQPQESQSANFALIIDNKCISCLHTGDKSLECWDCNRNFHAVCLNSEDGSEKVGKEIICPSTFYDSFLKASKKEGVWAKRSGNFTFVCDQCKVNKGKKNAATMSDKYTLLDNKIDAVNNSLLVELKELKSMLSPQNKSATTYQSSSISNTNKEYNPWHDKQRTDNLSKVVSVQKDNKGKLISSEKLEKICVQNGVSVHKTFHMKKSDTTGMVLNSQNDVDVLTAKLRDVDHSVVKVSTRVPTVHIVGLSKEYTPDELRSMIVKQNPGISTLFESTSTSTDDKLIDILSVKPLKNNVHIFKAIVIKVSNVIRSILAKQQNKVYIGYQSMCKVYDSIFVLRCFNCQGYGHHSEECENKDDPVCGFCSESHESRDCLKKTADHLFKCCHCVKAKNNDTNHHTGDPRCAVFVKHQNRIKSTIPFYQSK